MKVMYVVGHYTTQCHTGELIILNAKHLLTMNSDTRTHTHPTLRQTRPGFERHAGVLQMQTRAMRFDQKEMGQGSISRLALQHRGEVIHLG